jgi:hypothetical protein
VSGYLMRLDGSVIIMNDWDRWDKKLLIYGCRYYNNIGW